MQLGKYLDMGIGGIWQWVVVLVIVLVLFGGRGKISQLMGDFGKGLKSFKKGVKEDEPESVQSQDASLSNRSSEQGSSQVQPEKTESH